MDTGKRSNAVLWSVIAILLVANAITLLAFIWQSALNQKLRRELAVITQERNAARDRVTAPPPIESRLVFEAAQKGQVERLKALLDQHPELLNCRPYSSGSTPLHAAAFSGRDAAVKELLARKADVNAANISGLTPLHDCVHRGTLESAAMLLDHKADLTLRNTSGQTPLAYAEAKNRPDMVELLRNRGARE
jgi:hypothetical protein